MWFIWKLEINVFSVCMCGISECVTRVEFLDVKFLILFYMKAEN